jgi:hypothetical protein
MRSAYSIAPFIASIVPNLPGFAAKTAQTLAGLGESALDVVTPDSLYESRYKKDIREAREKGLPIGERFDYATHRQLPLLPIFRQTYQDSLGRAGELNPTLLAPNIARAATTGKLLTDYGEPGFDYYNSLRQGRLGELLIEDLGNTMLAGRVTGAKSLSNTLGATLRAEGRPGLGAAVEKTGYLAEQPIAASLSALAGGVRTTTGALARGSDRGILAGVSRAAGRVAESRTPIRAAGQQVLLGRQTYITNKIATLQTKSNQLERQITDAYGRNEPEAKIRKLEDEYGKIQDDLKKLRDKTGAGRQMQRAVREGQIEAERMQREAQQEFGRFKERGPVPESIDQLERTAQSLRQFAESQPDPVARQQYLDVAEVKQRAAEAKKADSEGRLSSPELIGDSFGAAVLVASGLVNGARQALQSGKFTFDQIIELLVPDETTKYLEGVGYKATPGMLRTAIDFADGQLDLVGQVGVESALSILQRTSDLITQKRQTGQGMVRGAGSPFETGKYPLPEYFVKELSKHGSAVQNFVSRYLDSAVESLVSRIYFIEGIDAFNQLNLGQFPNLKVKINANTRRVSLGKKPFETMANAEKGGPANTVAYQVLSQMVDDMNSGFLRPEHIPDGRVPSPELSRQLAIALRDPMIYPASARPLLTFQKRVETVSKGRDVEAMGAGIDALLKQFPDIFPENLVSSLTRAIDVASSPTKKYNSKSWGLLRGRVEAAISTLQDYRNRSTEKMGTLEGARQQSLLRLEQIETQLRTYQMFVENVVRNPEQFFPTETPEVARLRGVADTARAGIEAVPDLGPSERPFRPRTDIEANTAELQAERGRLDTDTQQVNRDIADTQSRLQQAETLTPDEIARLETDLDMASRIDQEYPYRVVDKTEVDLRVQEEIKDRTEISRRLEQDFNSISKGPLLDRRSLSEDLSSSIEQGLGAGANRKLYESFVRRWVAPKRASNPQTRRGGDTIPFKYDELAAVIKQVYGLDDLVTAEGAWTELARRWALNKRIKEELADLRSPEARKNIAKELQDQADALIDSERANAYRELGLVDEYGFPRTVDGYKRLIDAAKNTDVLRLRLEDLRRRQSTMASRMAEIEQAVAENASDVQRRLVESEASGLRSEEARATQQAEGLLSANLETQTRGVRGMLRGVGAVREGQPVLQRQFAGPLEAEQARLQSQEVAKQQKINELREKFAVEDAALAEAQAVRQGTTIYDEQLAQPTGPALMTDPPLYMPAGSSRFVAQQSSVSKRPAVEGALPEAVGGAEKMREGSILSMDPGQMMARVGEVLKQIGTNETIERIITDKQFVTTVADNFTPAELAALRKRAEAMHQNDFGRGEGTLENRINNDYKILLFDEIRKKGLEPVSPVELPDPTDIYAERGPVKALDQITDASTLTENTMLMSIGLRERLGAQFEATTGKVPNFIQRSFEKVSRGTGKWKTVVLPFSIIRWQLGDAMGNVMNAWVRGDIGPAELAKYARTASQMQLDPLRSAPRGPSFLTRTPQRRLMFGEELAGYSPDPLLQSMQSSGLQSSGLKQADIKSMTPESFRRDATGRLSGLDETTMWQPGVRNQRFGFMPGFRQGAFTFNEFQNRLARQAVAMKFFDDYLKEKNMTFDMVTKETLALDSQLKAALDDAVRSANEVLGNFSELSPFERQTVRTIYPFWSWIKFINKAAAQLAIDSPDRLVLMAHLGSLVLEPEAEGLWEFLRGKTEIGGKYFELDFLNPYTDAVPFMWDRSGGAFSAFIEQGESISPVAALSLLGLGETAYHLSGRRSTYLPSLSRPGYLEGRPGETTRTFRDTAGGLGYVGLKSFGGPFRNILEFLPDGRIPGTDVATGYAGLPRFPQGSLRTTGQFSQRRLSPVAGKLSAFGRTFGMPAPIMEVSVAERAAAENRRNARRNLQRRLKQRRLAQR